MNRYGQMAMDHWRDAFPDRFSQIPDLDSFFSTLGQEVATAIAEVEATLTEREPSSGGYLSNLASGRNAHLRAEEIVLAQRVYLTEELDERESREAGSNSGQEWIPLAEDSSHPWWRAERDNEE